MPRTVDSAEPTADITRAWLYRWGVAIATHRRPILVVWAAILVGCVLAYPVLEQRLGGMDFGVQGSESADVDRLLSQYFPSFGAEQDVIVFQSAITTADTPQYQAAVRQTLAAARGVAGVKDIIDPYAGSGQISPDRRVAIALIGIDGDMAQRSTVADQLQNVVSSQTGGPVAAAITGYSPVQNDSVQLQNEDVKRAEAIGVSIALVLLIFALGALAAAVVPVGVALAGLLVAVGSMLVASTVIDFDSLMMSMATMIGVGVGVDYAMFIVSRFREELGRAGVTSRRDDDNIAAAVGQSLNTAGKTILASGIIVMISLCSLLVMQAPVFRNIAVGVAIAVLSTLVVALTLLPALLAVLGPAVNRGALPKRWRPAEITDTQTTSSGWARWARLVMKRPLPFGAMTLLVLLVAAAPVLGIRYGLDMGTSALADKPSGRAAATLTANFPAGTLSPVEIVATGPDGSPLTVGQAQQVQRLIGQAARDQRVGAVLPVQESQGRQLITVVSDVAFDSAAAESLVRDLRAAAAEAATNGGPAIVIGGSTAEFVDLSDEMTSKLPLVIALVLASSMLFLMVVFRSVVLPLKAVLMNMLATGAALGLTVAVFQWGIGESVLDFTSPGFLQVYLPTVVFAVLFGLSMDYEVFLIRRMREYWDSGHDNELAVAAGLTHTARPITAAAAIMVAVFGSFVTANVLELKQIGFALAIAVAIDAVIVRLVLVPAMMRVLGQWNWWTPKLAFRAGSSHAEKP
ncbi:MMPL family transporter [Mycolicibacterium arseniciresistens]|uniref:Efflux RND transporter permease subunit n=1 Tax=Mycolicibacterium arseniciresistens TaxID=3062257 RepID=A0ABT8UK61_9MYCO|nr:efflux RND transporter permease subunit [Mycolicibacterium arseniciresistens]MDO3637215.1 efflux RND transporter permease subunit [Mycolicibacterium arseniciresistens]